MIHNGVNSNAILAVLDREADVSRSSGILILTLGTFSSIKGHDVLLRAFERIATVRNDVRLVIAGKKGEALEATRFLIRKLRLDSRVELFVDLAHGAAMQLLKSATVFVLPSREESFGIVILEAGVAGIPVVASDTGGVPEIIRDNQHGLLVAPDDPEALARAITRVLEEPGLRETLSRTLNRTVMSKFSWSASFGKYRRLAETLSQQRTINPNHE